MSGDGDYDYDYEGEAIGGGGARSESRRSRGGRSDRGGRNSRRSGGDRGDRGYDDRGGYSAGGYSDYDEREQERERAPPRREWEGSGEYDDGYYSPREGARDERRGGGRFRSRSIDDVS